MIISVLEHPRIHSEKRFNDIANTPLWSCLMGGYAVSMMEQSGHEVEFYDTTVSHWDFKKTKEEILNLSPDLLCVNCIYIWEHTDEVFNLFTDLKSAGFKGHINLFGFFPTLAYQPLLNKVKSVDSIAVGEFEYTVSELADRLCKGKEWRDIPGIAYHSSKGVKLTSQRIPETNPDRFPFPRRAISHNKTASLLASRGCYNHCSFCIVPSFYNNGARWNGRSPKNIIKEISMLIDQGISDFYFTDPNFIGPGGKGRHRTLDLIEQIPSLNITFGIETRANDLDPEIMENLVSAGLHTMLLGIESGSHCILKHINKGASINSGEKAIKLCRSVEIEPEIGFLMFVPDSTLEDLNYNMEFLHQNNLLNRLDRTANLLSHCQIVLMGTPGYKKYLSSGRLTPTGALGFEGKISFIDQKVKWISELVIFASLFVLDNMSGEDSPIYWRKNKDSPELKGVNDYLVSLFQRLLTEAQKNSILPPINAMKVDLKREMLRKIFSK